MEHGSDPETDSRTSSVGELRPADAAENNSLATHGEGCALTGTAGEQHVTHELPEDDAVADGASSVAGSDVSEAEALEMQMATDSVSPVLDDPPTDALDETFARRERGGESGTNLQLADISRRILGYDTYLVVWGGGTTLTPIPKPCAPRVRATPRRLLSPPLQSLADAVAPHRIIVECGGDGQCGPNALAFMLGLLGLFAGDGFALRRQIVQYVKGSSVLSHNTNFHWITQPDSALTVRDLMVENMKSWPAAVIAGRSLTAATWCSITEAAESWTDLTFVQLCAAKFRVTVNIIGVKGTGEVLPSFPVEPTPVDTQPIASCDLGCWLNMHFVAIIDVSDGVVPEGGDTDVASASVARGASGVSSSLDVQMSTTAAGGGGDAQQQGDPAPASEGPLEVATLDLDPRFVVDLRDAAQCTVVLLYVAVLTQPLVFAHLNGFQTLGFQLPAPLRRADAMKGAQRLCNQMWNRVLYAFMVGVHTRGWQLFAAPVPFAPPQRMICNTQRCRQRWVALGIGFAWCTLASLGGTPCGDAAARALLAAQCFIMAPSAAVSATDEGPVTFSTGATHIASALDLPTLTNRHSSTAADALRKLQSQDTMLRDLLTTAVDGTTALSGWLERIRPAPIDEIPDRLLEHLPDFSDRMLDAVELPQQVLPYQLPWSHLPPLQTQPGADAPTCPVLTDLVTADAHRRMRLWLKHQLSDMIDIRQQLQRGTPPQQVKRNRPSPLAIGQSEMQPWARGLIWDCRRECCVPLDFSAPFSSGLNLGLMRETLGCYPDQTLLSYLLEGVRLEADVELQTVMVPHLVSLSLGFASVDREIRRLQQQGWYDFFDKMPFFPMYLNGQGAVARKLEPDRYRRSTEGGGPRKETQDASGLSAISLNEAARTPHVPRYFQQDRRPAFQRWLRQRTPGGALRPSHKAWAPFCDEPSSLTDPNASTPPVANPRSKACKERKPTLADLMIALAVLCRAATVLKAPIYVFSDDAKDYFNQLGMSTSELWKLGIVFLDDFDAPPPHAKLVFVSEKRLGFGTHTASNTAQRFSDALLTLFADRMDENEAAHDPSQEHSNWEQWEKVRLQVQRNSSRPCHRTRRYAATHRERQSGIRVCPQLRLWHAVMYTDDPIFIVVGAQRAIRALRVWRSLTREVQLVMSIPEKRTLGSWALWLGVIIIAPLGLIVIPRNKLMRAATAINELLDHGCAFHIYRSLCGLLEHFRAVNLAKRNVMHGLYEPHGAEGVSRFGPNARVRCNPLMRKQMQRWRQLTFQSGGVDVRTAVVGRAQLPAHSITVILDSDACHGDEDHSAMGGYMHGQFWYWRIPDEDLPYVTTPLLEFVAVCLNILVFHKTLEQHEGTILLRTDALATALTLPSAKMKSSSLTNAYQEITATKAWRRLAARMLIRHLFGDCNVMADAVSRARWAEFYHRCLQLRIKPQQVPVNQAARLFYHRIIAHAKQRQIATVSFAGFRAGAVAERDADELDHLVRTPKRNTSAPTSAQTNDASSPLEADDLAHLVNVRTPPTLTAPPQTFTQPSTTTERLTAKRYVIQGLHFPTTPAATHASKRPLLTAASRYVATQTVKTFTAGSDGMQFGLDPPQAAVLLTSIQEGIEYGVNSNTGEIDERAWRMWLHVCAQYKTSPHRTAAEAQNYPQRNAHLMAALMMHAFSIGKPRDASRQFIRPRSALAYPLAIIRIFKRWSIQMPPISSLKGSLAHLSRLYIAYHGPYSLSPRRAEPMKYSMVLNMNAVYATNVQSIWWTDDDHAVFMFRRLNLILWPTGFRLAEIVHHASDEVMYLTYESLSWNIAGRIVTEPSARDMLHLVAGEDYARLAPPRAKPDQWGEIHCPYPVVLTYFHETVNAAAALRDLELRRIAYSQPPARSCMALIHDAAFKPFSHAFLDGMLKALLRHCYGNAVASLYTWHSYRSGLATALHAAGVDDGLIMLICRWMSPESLHVYRRMGTEEHERCTRKAMNAKVDLLLSSNVPKVMGDHGYAQLFAEFKAFNPLHHNTSTTDTQITQTIACATADSAVHLTPAAQLPQARRPGRPPGSHTAANAPPQARRPGRPPGSHTITNTRASPPNQPAAARRRGRPPGRRTANIPPADVTPSTQLPVSHVRHRFPPTLRGYIIYKRRPSTRPPPRDRYGVNRDTRC